MANCTVYEGHARFETLHDVRVGDELLSADRIFLNVGGRALVPNMAGLDQINYLTNTSMLDLEVLPRHLVIVGGGYVALEFAQMYRRFGSEVTVVEKGPRLIQREDEEVSAAVKDILEAEGIRIRLRAECTSFAQHGGDIAVCVDCVSGDREVVASHVLLAVGGAPIRTTSASTGSASKPARLCRLYHVEQLTPSASQGRCAGRLGPIPCARRQRSERKRAFSRRSARTCPRASWTRHAATTGRGCLPR